MAEELKKKILDLNKEIQETFNNEDNEVILDGIIDVDTYSNAKFKILWLLKEPYDNDGDGGWSMIDDVLSKDNVYDIFLKNTNSKKTWNPIIYASYGILNKPLLIDDIPNINTYPEIVVPIIKSIAFMNISKLPANSRSVESNIKALFINNKILLKKQFDLINPDIIIGCSTLQHYKNLFGLEESDSQRHETAHGKVYYVKNGKLFIEAHHPSEITTAEIKNQYIDDIILIVRNVF